MPDSTATRGCPAPDLLEKIAADGFDTDEASRAHLAACAACREALAEIKANNDFLAGVRAESGDLFDGGLTGVSEFLDALPSPEREGMQVGRYKLLQKIGEGGFGVVWMAEQAEPVRRRVAVKIVKPGMGSRTVIARFGAERQALAMMSHPGIAKVLDAGTTDAVGGMPGRPYFVMEYVRGAPITQFCDRERLTLEQRLRLFAAVCDAVQHAHVKGIIHRDLKPGNILVTLDDSGEPRPVVIDFGVAKALAGRLTDQTFFTHHGTLLGTPKYMSPEQAEMSETDIDTRTDVYALGVILYELLTGTVPFDLSALRDSGFAAIRRVIREDQPPRPSTRLAAANEKSAAAAAARRLRIEELASQLRKELEWIPLKALRKERGERYRSAAEMADDVQNYLAHRPLIAGPETARYKVRKFVKRNKVAVVAAAGVGASLVLAVGVSVWSGGAVAASLLLGTGVAVWFAARESAARRREAEERARAVGLRETAEANALAEAKARRRAEQTLAFVIKTLQASDPEAGGREDATVLSAMRNAIGEIESGAFRDDPEIDAALRDTIGTVLLNNGHPAEAERLCAGAVEMCRRAFKGTHAATARSLNNLASARQQLGRAAEAEPLFVEALEMNQRLFKGPHWDVAQSLNNLASVRLSLGRPAEAEPLFVQSLEMCRALFNSDHPDLATAVNNLAGVRSGLGKKAQAEPLYAEAVAMYRRLFPDGHPDMAVALSNLANVRLDLGAREGVEPLLIEAMGIYERLFPGDNPSKAMCLGSLSRVRAALGKTTEARQGFDAATAMLRRLSPNGSPVLARTLWRSGTARLDAGDAAAAFDELDEAASMAEKFLPPRHPHLRDYVSARERSRAALG